MYLSSLLDEDPTTPERCRIISTAIDRRGCFVPNIDLFEDPQNMPRRHTDVWNHCWPVRGSISASIYVTRMVCGRCLCTAYGLMLNADDRAGYVEPVKTNDIQYFNPLLAIHRENSMLYAFPHPVPMYQWKYSQVLWSTKQTTYTK